MRNTLIHAVYSCDLVDGGVQCPEKYYGAGTEIPPGWSVVTWPRFKGYGSEPESVLCPIHSMKRPGKIGRGDKNEMYTKRPEHYGRDAQQGSGDKNTQGGNDSL